MALFRFHRRRSTFLKPLALLVPVLAFASTGLGSTDSPRRPVAMAVDDDELLVANRDGTLTVIDAQALSVSAEIDVGLQLSAIALPSTGRSAMIADEQNHELVVMSYEAGQWRAKQRLNVPLSPVSLQ